MTFPMTKLTPHQLGMISIGLWVQSSPNETMMMSMSQILSSGISLVAMSSSDIPDDDVDVPDILIWDIAGASMTRQNGNDDDDDDDDDDDVDIPDIIIWDIAGGGVTE